MSAAPQAVVLDAYLAQLAVRTEPQLPVDRLPEARPSGVAIVLGLGHEEREEARPAEVGPGPGLG